MEEQREVIELRCPLCVKEGRTEPAETPTTHVWVPALYPRWVPKWAQERGFLSLEEAVLKAPAFSALIKEHRGRKEAEQVCNAHGRLLRDAKIWTSQLSWVLQKQAAAAQARAEKAFGAIAASLGGETVAEIRSAAEAEAKPKRTQKPRGGKREKERGSPPRNPPHNRPEEKRRTKEEIEEALVASEETS